MFFKINFKDNYNIPIILIELKLINIQLLKTSEFVPVIIEDTTIISFDLSSRSIKQTSILTYLIIDLFPFKTK